MKHGYVTDAERCAIMERFEERGGTLNGKRALVCGRQLDFPFVAVLDGSGLKVEFSWAALRRVVMLQNRVDLRS